MKKISPRHFLFLFAFLLLSCTPVEAVGEASPKITPSMGKKEISQQETVATPTPQKKTDEKLKLIPITTENLGDLEIIKEFTPFFPPISTVSGNFSVIAVGDLRGVRIFDAELQSEIMVIDVDLPVCNFGFDAFLALDHSGQFIGIITTTGIEVWEVGGGRIYSAPFLHGRAINPLTCGLDLPQIALSPGGQWLAEGGFGAGGEEYGDYFRVIDIIKNEIVYFWDGDPTHLHGQLSTFQNLGFSSDGKVLQTFDPERYQMVRVDDKSPFMFWLTDTWKAVNADSLAAQDSLSPGDQLFARSADGLVKLYQKGSWNVMADQPEKNCTQNYPCDVIFSPNGDYFAILISSENVNYRRKRLITEIRVYSLSNGEILNSYPTLLRHKYGVRLNNEGEPVYLASTVNGASTWWTNTAYLSGFSAIKSERIGFIPQVVDVMDDAPMYSGTCAIELSDLSLICEPEVRQLNGPTLSVSQIQDGFVLSADGRTIAQIKYPQGSVMDTWQIRLKGYDNETGVGYFCLDRNQREETCVIMDFMENEILKEQIDLFGFIHSDENDLSAFIDREVKKLNIFNEASGRMTTMGSYHAIAYPVSPALFSDGDRAIYIVHNTDTANLFIEEISLVDAAVLRRYDFDGLGEFIPTAVGVHPSGDFWIVGDDAGNIHFLDPKTSKINESFHASRVGIVDAMFSEDGNRLVLMDENGIISIWGVRK